MSMFGEYLRQLISGRNISIAKLSRDSNVERTAIHRALAGERILPYHAVEAFINCLKLSPGEIRILRSYYDELFESETVCRRRNVIDGLYNRLASFSAMGAENRERMSESLQSDMLKGTNIFKGYAQISRLLHCVVEEEMKHNKPKLELAIPVDAQPVMKCIEEIYKGNSRMSVSHILCFDSCVGAEADNLHNLENMAAVLPGCFYSKGQYHIYYYYNDMAQVKYTAPLPYFVLTGKAAICFSENCQTALFLKKDDQIEYFKACFYRLKESCHNLVEYQEEPKRLSELFEKSGGKEGCCMITSESCLLNLKIPKMMIIFQRSCILDFLRSGQLYNFKEGSTENVRAEDRLGKICTFLEMMHDNDLNSRVINEAAFCLPENFTVISSASCCVFLYGSGRKGAFKIRLQEFCEALYDWSIHFSKGEEVCDGEKTMEALKEMISLEHKKVERQNSDTERKWGV